MGFFTFSGTTKIVPATAANSPLGLIAMDTGDSPSICRPQRGCHVPTSYTIRLLPGFPLVSAVRTKYCAPGVKLIPLQLPRLSTPVLAEISFAIDHEVVSQMRTTTSPAPLTSQAARKRPSTLNRTGLVTPSAFPPSGNPSVC